MKNKFVDISGYSFHMNCSGVSNPLVILEAGLNQPGSSWTLVQREVEKFIPN